MIAVLVAFPVMALLGSWWVSMGLRVGARARCGVVRQQQEQEVLAIPLVQDWDELVDGKLILGQKL